LDIGVEIQDFTEPNLSESEMASLITRYKELFKDFKHIKAIHGPFLDLKPASPDKDIRRVSQEKYYNILKVAKELAMDYVIFHTQMNPLLNEPKIKALNYEQNAQFYNLLIKKTDYKGVILIENIFEKKPEDMKSFVDQIDSDRIKVNLDIGHGKLGD